MVDLELYKIFKIVADRGNLTRASEFLNISQPAITKNIHNLENELQIKLFNRTKYGMVLTSEGEKIYNQIKEPINILMNIEKNLKEIDEINLGVHTNIPKEMYRQIIEEIKKYNSNIDINIEKSPTENMFSMLEKNEIDAYLSKKQPEDLHSKTIKFIKLGYFHDSFFVKRESKYLNEERINRIINGNDEVIIYTLRNISSTSKNLEKMLQEKELKNVKIKNMTFNTIREKIRDNDIITYITEEYMQDEIKKGDLKKLDLKIDADVLEYGLYYNDSNKVKNIKRLLNKLK